METIIADAGPLVAYLKKDEQDHEWAKEVFQTLKEPMLTCEAVLSEAFFLLRRTSGQPDTLLGLLERGALIVDFSLSHNLNRIAALMRRYNDVPMSLADACLVRMSELRSKSKIVTMDRHFQIYRRNGRRAIPMLAPF